jgi:hypothetical protein
MEWTRHVHYDFGRACIEFVFQSMFNKKQIALTAGSFDGKNICYIGLRTDYRRKALLNPQELSYLRIIFNNNTGVHIESGGRDFKEINPQKRGYALEERKALKEFLVQGYYHRLAIEEPSLKKSLESCLDNFLRKKK